MIAIGKPKDVPRDPTMRDEAAIRDLEFHLANLTAALLRHCGKTGAVRAAEVRKVVREAVAEMLAN